MHLQMDKATPSVALVVNDVRGGVIEGAKIPQWNTKGNNGIARILQNSKDIMEYYFWRSITIIEEYTPNAMDIEADRRENQELQRNICRSWNWTPKYSKN